MIADYSEHHIFVSSQYEEVDAEQLQRLLNHQILKGLENTWSVARLQLRSSLAFVIGIFGFIFISTLILGDLKSGGFSMDACRSMVALMDVSSHSGSLH